MQATQYYQVSHARYLARLNEGLPVLQSIFHNHFLRLRPSVFPCLISKVTLSTAVNFSLKLNEPFRSIGNNFESDLTLQQISYS